MSGSVYSGTSKSHASNRYTDNAVGKDWVSISLEYMAIELDPPLKLDSGMMMIDPRVTQRRGQMLNMRHNLEQHQAHACVTVPVLAAGRT